MTTLQICFLGPGTICTDKGTALTVRARKELAVLVYLLLEQSQPLLQRAYSNLQKQASLVPEGETRHAFLENIPAHRRIYRRAIECLIDPLRC